MYYLFLHFKLIIDHREQVDWDKATTDFQCASVGSMKTMACAMMKKVENAGGKVGVAASTPTPKKGRAKKRKANSADEDDDEEATPVVKKKGRKDTKTAEAPVDCELSLLNLT